MQTLFRGTNPLIRDERGVVLALVLFVMVVLTLLGVLGIYRVGQDIGQAGDFRRDSQAFYIAEAGIYRAVAELNDDINWAGPFTNMALGNGSFTVTRTDPDPLRMVLTSVGTTNTNPPSQVTLQAVGLKVGSPPPLFQFAIFTTQNLSLGGSNQVTGGNVYAGMNVDIETSDAVVDGDVLGYLEVRFKNGNNSIRNGNVYANQLVDLTTQNRVRVDGGDVWSGGSVAHGDLDVQVVGGTVNENVSPPPVRPPSYYEDNYKFTAADFNEFFNQASAAGNLHIGDLHLSGGNYTGVHYVTGDLKVSGQFSGDAVWVVDGSITIDGNINVANEDNFTFISRSDIRTTGMGGGSVDAHIYADGPIFAAGNTTINGGVISFGGVAGKGNFAVNYKTPSGLIYLPGGAEKFKIISLARL